MGVEDDRRDSKALEPELIADPTFYQSVGGKLPEALRPELTQEN
jgi:hypothetical protein